MSSTVARRKTYDFSTSEPAPTLGPLLNKVFNEDCLVGMRRIPDKSVDLILCDLPYGTTQCKWDSVIPLDQLWHAYKRVIKDNGAIVLTAAQPFTSVLVMSMPDWFRYSWVWEKSKATGYLNSKRRPLCAHEDILVFSRKAPEYFPQMVEGEPYDKGTALRPTAVYGAQKTTTVRNETGLRYPRSVQYFKTAESEGNVIHPTQKPIALFEYLVRTYTRPGQVVLDNCMGSGTTAVACSRLDRKFIGFESENDFCNALEQRLRQYIPGFEVARPEMLPGKVEACKRGQAAESAREVLKRLPQTMRADCGLSREAA